MNKREELIRGLDLMEIPHSDVQINGVLKYLDELLLWNPTHGLVSGEGGSREAPPDLVARHILDSLAPLNHLLQGNSRTLGDIGSGAGFPGIPLALFMADTEVTLVEKQGRRCNFLRNAVAVLGLKDRVKVEQRAMEKLNFRFDIVSLRAFADVSAVYGDLRALTAPGGRIAAYKGQRIKAEQEIRRLEGAAEPPCRMELLPLDVPFLKAERTLLLISP